VSAVGEQADVLDAEVAIAAANLVTRLHDQIEEMADITLRGIFADVSAYEDSDDPDFLADVRAHILKHHKAVLDTLAQGRAVTAEDLLFTRKHAAQRVGTVSVVDFIHAFQVGQHTLLDAALALAVDDLSRRAVLVLVSTIARYFDVAIAHAADVYLEAEQLLASTGERVRRDLLENLLAGTPPPPGPRLDAAREAGLDLRGACLVITAVPTIPAEDLHALRAAATALARSTRQRTQPLTVVRHDEIVIVASSPTEGAEGLSERLADTQQRLAQRSDLPLAVGISTVYEGLAAVGDAYCEAVTARDRLLPNPGVAALPAMTMFDYLTKHSNRTARRIVPPAIDRFVSEDLHHGGVLLATLDAYADANLNAKRAAEHLHIHVNTAHYRLAKIAERTECDLHCISDVIELLIAARIASATA
jgi:sugar diacid utilization regulator